MGSKELAGAPEELLGSIVPTSEAPPSRLGVPRNRYVGLPGAPEEFLGTSQFGSFWEPLRGFRETYGASLPYYLRDPCDVFLAANSAKENVERMAHTRY